jgi:peptide/nickel transport system permease protein
MAAYALRRLLLALATLWLAGSLVFLFLLLLPGDPVQAILGLEASPEARAALERSLGLNRPPLERYLAWLWGLLQLDLGESIRYAKPVLALILERLPLTLALTALGLLGALSLALPLALLALRHRALDLLLGGLMPSCSPFPPSSWGWSSSTPWPSTFPFFPQEGFPGGIGPSRPSATSFSLP